MQNLENFALALCRQKETAKDLISNTVMIAYEQFDNLRNKQAFLSFLYTICKREFYSKFQNKSDQIPLDDFSINTLYRIELSIEDRLDIEFILYELDKMDSDTKDAVLLHYVSGLTYVEIANIQSKTKDAVKMSVHRAKNQIRENLRINK